MNENAHHDGVQAAPDPGEMIPVERRAQMRGGGHCVAADTWP